MRWGERFFLRFEGHTLLTTDRMGKTIQIIALFVSDEAKPNLVIAYVFFPLFRLRSCLDSVTVSPTVAVMQWRNEIEAHTDGLKVLVWHGSSRQSDTTLLEKYDVVRQRHDYANCHLRML